MLSAAQQRAKDAEEMRARIDAERIALARTTEMGQKGAHTWASEAHSLREKIGAYEAQLLRLKGRLGNMDFDERGIDLRVVGPADVSHTTTPDPSPAGSHLVTPSTSGDNIAALKTSPIESTESCSSVDDALEAGNGCDNLAADLSRLLTLSANTTDLRAKVEQSIQIQKPVIDPSQNASDDAGKDLVHLVRAATKELDLAIGRIEEIKERREKAALDPVPANFETPQLSQEAPHLETQVAEACEKHTALVESSKSLRKEADHLCQASKEGIVEEELPDDAQSSFVEAVSKPLWFVDAVSKQDSPARSAGKFSPRQQAAVGNDLSQTATDFDVVQKAMHTASVALRKSRAGSGNQRKRHGTQSMDSLTLNSTSQSLLSPSSVHDESDPLRTPSTLFSSGKVTPRSVRFAALPPSYSATRSFDTSTKNPYPQEASAAVHIPIPPSNLEDGTFDSKELEVDLKAVKVTEQVLAPPPTNPSTGKARDVKQKKDHREPTETKIIPASDKDVRRAPHGAAPMVTSQRPPRLQRTQTPRRIMRRKEAIQRSVVPLSGAQGKPREVTRPRRSFSSYALRMSDSKVADKGSSISAVANSQAKSLVPTESTTTSNVDGEKSVAKVQHDDSITKETLPIAIESIREKLLRGEDVRREMESAQDSREETLYEVCSEAGSEPVQKRLFSTPESASSSSRVTRQNSSLFGRKQGLLRRSTVNALQSFKAARGKITSSSGAVPPAHAEFTSKENEVSAPPSSGDDDLMLSPLSKPSRGDSFFAGQTAEWQQNVQAQNDPDDANPPHLTSTIRASTESTGSATRAKPKPGPVKGSRIQSFRARLAALK